MANQKRGARRDETKKNENQSTKLTASKAPSSTTSTKAAEHRAASNAEVGEGGTLCSGANGDQEDSDLATLRARSVRALAELQQVLAAVRLQRAARCRLARNRYDKMLRSLRAQRVQQEIEKQNRMENLMMRTQQHERAVETLQDAARSWLIARAAQRDVQQEEEPEWLVRAGEELEQMLHQWQQRQEERLEEQELKPRLIDPGGSPPNAGRHCRRATDSTMSPAQFRGHGKALHTRAGGEAEFTKQSGGRQRKLKIAQNAAARGAGPQDAGLHTALAESEVYAQSVQAEQDRMERQVCAEVEEARQLAAAIQASMDKGIVGSQSTGATGVDDDIEEQFRELCDAAGVAPGDVYRPASQLPRAVEDVVFKRNCRRVGVTVACGGQRERLRRLHVARARSELFMRNKLGKDWRRAAERNLEVSRARYAAQRRLEAEAQMGLGGGRRVGGAGS